MNKKGNKYLFTEEEEAAIVARIKAGEIKRDIAASLGIGFKPIERLIKKHNLNPMAIQHVQLEGDVLESIVELYCKKGWSVTAIARHYGVWIPRIREALVGRGIEIRATVTSEEREKAIIHDYVHSGLDTEALCRKHRVTEKVVRRLVRKHSLVRLVQPIYTTARERMGGRTCYEHWVFKYGKEEADKRKEAASIRHSRRSKGKNNPMYGRSAPQGSGNGWKGWYKGTFFRSLRELFFLIEMEEKGIHWESAEQKKYESKYVDHEGVDRTYRPDYIADGAMIEIKPRKMWNTPTVQLKRNAALPLCEQLGLEYRFVDPPICREKLLRRYEEGVIKWTEKTQVRFEKYYEIAAL